MITNMQTTRWSGIPRSRDAPEAQAEGRLPSVPVWIPFCEQTESAPEMLPEEILFHFGRYHGMGSKMQEYAVSQCCALVSETFDDYQVLNCNRVGGRCQNINVKVYHRYSRGGRAQLKSGRSALAAVNSRCCWSRSLPELSWR